MNCEATGDVDITQPYGIANCENNVGQSRTHRLLWFHGAHYLATKVPVILGWSVRHAANEQYTSVEATPHQRHNEVQYPGFKMVWV